MNILAFWHDGAGPGPWVLLFPFLWIAVVAGVLFLLRRTVWRGRCGPGQWSAAGRGPERPAPHENTPVDLLGRRFASGEIDEDEYWRRFAVLQEGGSPPKEDTL